jgi:hypothetical protein
MATPFDPAHKPVDIQATTSSITAGQISYLTDLMTRKAAIVNGDVSAIAPWVTSLSKVAASKRIDEIRNWLAANAPAKVDALPETGAVWYSDMPDADVVPEGRYALATEPGAVNTLAFYKVDRPTEGRWAGYVFVKLLVSDVEKRLSWKASVTVLAKIAELGADAASKAYGREARKCGICGHALTNDESRKRGIGPDCAERMGW